MPELPEVAALASYLDGRLRDARIAKVQIASIAVLKTADPPYYALENRAVAGVSRFGKFVAIDAGGLFFVFHLARAGWARVTESPSTAPLKLGKGPIAARLRFSFNSDEPDLGVDLTEAGTHKGLAVYVVNDPREVPGIASLGPDPFAPAFTVEVFAEILASSGHQIKGLLRNQGTIAGIGNAYSDEILHAARISPFAVANKLDADSVQTLYDAIHSVLGAAVQEAGGKPPSELKDAKRSHMRVHGRAGQACPVCGDTVREVSFADSALQYCPTCQTKGKILADRRTSKFLK
ncbi:DNA-formamidopyrimidine glycosylase family protein [Pseudarthrobacter sp. J75]|uniref:Fpg/Nei family DNA glycosylase n=1 Tax=unclassified Pseudarthrobacter TaxID=2647000 RepID=UPI002E81B5F4|nr:MULTISPECIES: DNA-formamidopyrimidine glycosylase family protein [unclassified Pseudarthrobacter]MEE2522795.1 DNA-formamidopyrimidine glycosylase family protein [Pseudarthrobacter sp. J47]MEE2529656.1 DNA-formamidopyrimidine glycosylase family protein [Pseudarthrobacter sp. J75]MEE2569576.1 DNA-formamidopyrimidine glycosylase family protein [Pseudarthrobacter sp. J64]